MEGQNRSLLTNGNCLCSMQIIIYVMNVLFELSQMSIDKEQFNNNLISHRNSTLSMIKCSVRWNKIFIILITLNYKNFRFSCSLPLNTSDIYSIFHCRVQKQHNHQWINNERWIKNIKKYAVSGMKTESTLKF